MKNIFIGIIGLTLFIVMSGCSNNTDPQFRIKNEQPNSVNVSVQAPEGKRISLNDIEAGRTTEYQKTAEGNITITVITKNESVSFLTVKNMHYTIIVSPDKAPTVQTDL